MQKHSDYFLVIVALFIVSLLTANIIAVKLFTLQGFILPVAVIIFPISYIVGDVLTEVYGYIKARKVIWLGFGCNILMVLAFAIGSKLPAPDFWQGQSAYDFILGSTPRMLLASFVAYLAGELLNSYILAKMKIWTQGRHLWARTIGSTIIGQGADSCLFISIAFYDSLPLKVMATMIFTQWLTKTIYEALITPVTYKVISYFKEKEGIDIYDTQTDFNPILF